MVRLEEMREYISADKIRSDSWLNMTYRIRSATGLSRPSHAHAGAREALEARFVYARLFLECSRCRVEFVLVTVEVRSGLLGEN